MSKRFSDEEVERIKELTDLGYSYVQIAQKIKRSEEGVRYRVILYRTTGATELTNTFTRDEDRLILNYHYGHKSFKELADILNRPVTLLRKRRDVLKFRAQQASKQKAEPARHMKREISNDPADFPIQAENHLIAILNEDPRGFPAYTDTGNPKATLAVKLPLVWKGAN